MFDGVAFGKEMVGIVKGHVERKLRPLLDRLDALEQRSAGISEDAARQMVSDAVTKAIAELPPPVAPAEPWRPTDDEIRLLLQPMVDALPKPESGKSVTVDDVEPMIAEQVAKAIAALPVPKDGRDGKSVSVDDLAPLLQDLVDKAAASIPVPVNGKDGKDGQDGTDGRDGLDAVTPILKDGLLLFTMSDGSIKEVGRIVGADGKDGEAGRDGTDGLGFDDMVAEYDGERGIVLRFARGEQIKEFAFTMPVVIDRGVWVEGKEYAAGDAVTWGGSLWIAQNDMPEGKPDGGEGWRLAVKRGRDGKPGKDGELKVHQPVKVS